MEGERYQPSPEEIKKAEETMLDEQKMQSEARAEGYIAGHEEGQKYEKSLSFINQELGRLEFRLVQRGLVHLDGIKDGQKEMIRACVGAFIDLLEEHKRIYEDAERLGVKFDDIKVFFSGLRRLTV